MRMTCRRGAGLLSVALGLTLLLGAPTALGVAAGARATEPAACTALDCDPASELVGDDPAPEVGEQAAPERPRSIKPSTSEAAQLQRNATGPSSQSARAAQSQSATVDIGDDFFSPKNMTVAVGTTVTWTNKGERPHTVTADDESFDSGGAPQDYIYPGQTFSHTFTKAGSFPYYCRLHGDRGGVGQAGVINVAAEETEPDEPQQPADTPDPKAEDSPGTAGADSDAAETSTGVLAETGAEHLYLAPTGLALIVVGSALLLAPRRRST